MNKPKKELPLHRPFSRLKLLVETKQLTLAADPCKTDPSKTDEHPPLTRKQEDELFAKAMDDVTPLQCNRHWQWPKGPIGFKLSQNREEEETVAALHNLIRTGQGFMISQTDEYMEASKPCVHPQLIERLHKGRFSIQAHIDLHGLFAREAESTLFQFIKQSVQRGYSAVLVIHGRGLKSPAKPVLKAKVFQWLTRGPLRAHVIALASARACDGGAGATYVLLRRTPMSKKQRKPGPQCNRKSLYRE